MARTTTRPSGRLLTVAEAADRLNTTLRYPRRLIEERRITFVKIGRHVRIPESALDEFITAGVVEPVRLHSDRAA
ncbi:helix-turn-helix domain-containing protein [Nocardiopsis baichengensis]|uniref:helix-turn-helix domain-containing protein n=1 Tax=Nocardiopsis baichengensis TaxID=280240 RepID=UPI00034B01E3|nr:helix-turn-helix domain-containing protein [Nocardiopsis baichengensis]